MARKPRVVAVGIPHHITQRGVDRRDVFAHDRDRVAYLETLFEHAARYRVRIQGYCLMTNHVHVVAVPGNESGLAFTFGRTHSDYARYANVLRRGCGHLWQARFYSCPLDAVAVWRALAYIERNPVRAGMVAEAEEYAWSSAQAHCSGSDEDGRLEMGMWAAVYSGERWREVLRTSVGEEAFQEWLRQATGTGLPLGSEAFVAGLERRLQRSLARRPPGRPPKVQAERAAAARMV